MANAGRSRRLLSALRDHRMTKVIWVPDGPDRILVLRIGCRFDEGTTSNLVKMTLDGKMESEEKGDRHNAAYVVHGAFIARDPMSCASCIRMLEGVRGFCSEGGLGPRHQVAAG